MHEFWLVLTRLGFVQIFAHPPRHTETRGWRGPQIKVFDPCTVAGLDFAAVLERDVPRLFVVSPTEASRWTLRHEASGDLTILVDDEPGITFCPLLTNLVQLTGVPAGEAWFLCPR